MKRNITEFLNYFKLKNSKGEYYLSNSDGIGMYCLCIIFFCLILIMLKCYFSVIIHITLLIAFLILCKKGKTMQIKSFIIGFALLFQISFLVLNLILLEMQASALFFVICYVFALLFLILQIFITDYKIKHGWFVHRKPKMVGFSVLGGVIIYVIGMLLARWIEWITSNDIIINLLFVLIVFIVCVCAVANARFLWAIYYSHHKR